MEDRAQRVLAAILGTKLLARRVQGRSFTPTSIATGSLLTLSKQQPVDGITVDSACISELMNNGFAFAAKNVICTEANYSYICFATKGTCKASLSSLMEVSRGTDVYLETADRLRCWQWRDSPCLQPLRQTSPHFNHTYLVCTATTDWIASLFWVAWSSAA